MNNAHIVNLYNQNYRWMVPDQIYIDQRLLCILHIQFIIIFSLINILYLHIS